MRSFVILSLALLACLPAASQNASSSTDEMMASALHSLVLESSEELMSYSFLMDMEQDLDLVSLSSNESQRLVTRTFGFGAANMTDKILKLSLVALTYDEDDTQNTSTIAIEEYLKNDTLYMKIDGNWTALKMPSVSDAWSQGTTMDQQIQIINQSRLTLLGSEAVEGQDCYKVRSEMDQGLMAGQLSEEASSLLPDLGINFSEIFSNTSISAVYWIAKDTHNLKKTEVVENFIINPQSLGLPAEESGPMEMRINSRVSMLFRGYNESIAIALPAEAESAPAFPAGLMTSEDAVPVAMTDDEAVFNESAQNASLAGPVQDQNETVPENQIPNQTENQTANQIVNQNVNQTDLENNSTQAAA